MTTLFRAAAVYLVAVCLVAASGAAQTRYVIDVSRAASSRLGITVDTRCPAGGCEFQLPVWSATYQIRDFSQHVFELRAADADGNPLPVSKVNPSRWRVRGAAPDSRVIIEYQAAADRPGPFGSYADAEHVCLNLAQVLIYPVAQRSRPFTLAFENVPKAWRAALTLAESDGLYSAPSYDLLIDTPVHLSDFAETEFLHAGRPIRIVVDGRPGAYSLPLITAAIKKIVRSATAMMADVPFASYTFVYHFSDGAGGGMEYRNGTSIWAPADCRNCNMAALSAHEFIHLWNVKRIRPQSLEPVDFTRANFTPSLWFAEGVTSAAAEYIRLDAGLTTPAEFLSHLAGLITYYESRPASRRQSAEESSIDAWLERYAAYGRADRSVSYYLKGELIGHLIDLTVRRRTGNRRSLDHVMRKLNRDYARRGLFFEDSAAVSRAVNEVAGADLSDEFHLWVRTAEPIDWNRYLGFAGLRLAPTRKERPGIGLDLTAPPGRGVLVSAVEPESAAERAGFRTGDRIFTIEGKRVVGGPADILKRLEASLGRKVSIGAERGGVPRFFELTPKMRTVTEFQIVETDNPSESEKNIRRGWLNRETSGEPRPPASAGR